MRSDSNTFNASDTATLPLILRLAQKLWGAQTSFQGTEHKFGNKVVNIQSGAWFDFDANEGGFLRELMQKATVAAIVAELPAPKQYWHGETDPLENIRWLFQDLLPETGFGLLAAQWGMYKTFIAIDIGACTMTGQSFLRFASRRRGGVMFVAAEGASTIGVRLAAVVEQKCNNADKMPFTWLDACPLLVDASAVDSLVKTATETNTRMMSEFGVPLVLIVIDTIAVAAGYQERGDENDSTIGSRLTATMSNLAKRTNTFVLGVDHFGKAIETGTRGTSVKETNPDVLLVSVGERTVTGRTQNTRLALRKRRTGENGEEFAYRPRVVDLGVDENGSTITSVIIEWQSGRAPSATDHWASGDGMAALRKALSIALRDHGVDFQARDYVAPVRAVAQRQVREQFNVAYPPSADDDPARRREAVKKAFGRAIKAARIAELIGAEDTGTEVLIWEKPDLGIM